MIRKIAALALVFCLVFCIAGCGDAYSNFKPTSVYVIDRINGGQYEYEIDDEDTASKLWKKFKSLEIYEDSEAELGQAYLYMIFYNEDESAEAVFTIYENGSCCLGYDYETLHTVENGRTAYIDFCEIYESYVPEE